MRHSKNTNYVRCSKMFKIEDWLTYGDAVTRESADLVGERFEFLEKKIMYLLQGTRSGLILQLLAKYFYPIWRYYINFYMNAMLLDEYRRDDTFQKIYLTCCEMLTGVKYKDNTFNRIKRYYNKSIYGLVLNTAYKSPRDLLYVEPWDDRRDMLQELPDRSNSIQEFEVSFDIDLLQKHLLVEFPVYFERCATFRKNIYAMKEVFEERFRTYVLREFKKSGKLLSGEEVFGRRYVGVLT